MRTSFPFVGNCPVIKDILAIIVRVFLSSNTKFGIELGPVAFSALRETMLLFISFSIAGLSRNKVKF